MGVVEAIGVSNIINYIEINFKSLDFFIKRKLLKKEDSESDIDINYDSSSSEGDPLLVS